MKKKEGNINKLKPTSTTVEQGDDNERDHNQNIIDAYNLKDNIAYSTVNLSIKEPNVRVAEIAVTNTKSIDAKYKTNFFYEAKLSIINGFYLIQQFLSFCSIYGHLLLLWQGLYGLSALKV